MKICHVITRMIIGGAQENTLLNCLDLVRLHGDEVLLVTGPSHGPEGDLLTQAGMVRHPHVNPVSDRGRAGRSGSAIDVATHHVAGELAVCQIDSLRRNIHPWHDAVAYRQLVDVIQRFQPDVVHTHSAKGGLLGRAAAWKLKVPAVVHSVHGAPFHQYQSAAARRFFIGCERWAAGRCHHFICVADAMTDLMVGAGVAPPDRFTTISSGMDVEPFVHASDHRAAVRQRLGIGDEDVVIGKVARLFHLKGHADLIAAATTVVERCPSVRFLLVGDGLLRGELEAEIERLGLREHFILTGLVPPSEVPALIGAMDGLVHTSYREGLARALPQALIAGRPVVSYDIDGAREVVIDGETGFLVAAGDRAMLADRLSRLAGDPALRSQMGRAGQGRFTDQFRHEVMTRKIRELYQQIRQP